MRWHEAGVVVASVFVIAACGEDPSGPPFSHLSDYGFFAGELSAQEPAEDVVPYTVAAVLWSDGAGKDRFIVPPAGEAVVFTEGEDWTFPVGTTVIKSFSFDHDHRDPGQGRRLIETRLLVREADGWQPYVYVWNDEQTDAERTIAGRDVTVDYVDTDGAPQSQLYLVPDGEACKGCHDRDDQTELLGPFTAQLNRDVVREGQTVNQLEWLAGEGLLDRAVPDPSTLPAFADPYGTQPLDARARGYLHANCAHCHRPGGNGGISGLSFLEWETDPASYGICKIPSAAGGGAGGRTHDIVPGRPDDSIVVFRMQSTDPDVKMPELPNLIPDAAGVALVSEWIMAMDPPGCG